MKVAIDSGPLKSGHSVRGIGAHTRELISALKEEIKKEKDISIETFDFSENKERIASGKYDVLHYTAFSPFFISIPFSKYAKRVVLTIHDLIPLIYPKHYPGGIRGKIRFAINKILINRNVDKIITISETSKKDICRFLHINPSKVKVIYLAQRSIFRKIANRDNLSKVSKKYNLPSSFVLYVGDVNYNKNILGLVKACKEAKIPLVICGKQAKEVEESINLTHLLGPMDYARYLFGKPHPEIAHYYSLEKVFKEANVLRLGYVPEADLVAIYNLASLYIQPSFYEGFGLPVLEAMASGCPVISSKAQALVEIGESASIYFDPDNFEELLEKIESLFKNEALRDKLTKKGLERVKNFSWSKTARETLTTYQDEN